MSLPKDGQTDFLTAQVVACFLCSPIQRRGKYVGVLESNQIIVVLGTWIFFGSFGSLVSLVAVRGCGRAKLKGSTKTSSLTSSESHVKSQFEMFGRWSMLLSLCTSSDHCKLGDQKVIHNNKGQSASSSPSIFDSA